MSETAKLYLLFCLAVFSYNLESSKSFHIYQDLWCSLIFYINVYIEWDTGWAIWGNKLIPFWGSDLKFAIPINLLLSDFEGDIIKPNQMNTQFLSFCLVMVTVYLPINLLSPFTLNTRPDVNFQGSLHCLEISSWPLNKLKLRSRRKKEKNLMILAEIDRCSN